MADTKTSALTAVSSVTSAQDFPCNDSGTTRRATGAQIKTYVNTDPDFAAGSATAGSWPNLASGTVLTTPEAGAIERDSDVFYMTRAASQRGLVPNIHFCVQDATYTLTSTTNAQKLFNASTNGTLTLETGYYKFECIFALTSMSGTSGNGQFQILGGGSATLGAVLYHVVGIDGATATAATQTGSYSVTSSSAASMVTAGTNANMCARVSGMFEVTGAGTIIPSIALVTAATPIVSVGSYFLCYKIAPSGANATVGNWS